MSTFSKAIEKPAVWVRQLSGRDVSGQPVLSVLVKVRYRLVEGSCVDPEAVELLEEARFSDDGLVMEQDADVFPVKFATDVLVYCSVHGGGRAVVDASLEISGNRVDWRFFGNRVVESDGAGGIRFSSPEPFEEIELGFRRSYGGTDVKASLSAEPQWKEIFEPYSIPEGDIPDHASPFSYARNPAGKGFVLGVDPTSAIGVTLPNIENPNELLTPGNLLCRDLLSWPSMPMPAPGGWMSYEWFPRSGYCNLVRPYHAELVPFAEVERGFASTEVADPQTDSLEAGHRFACGASAGLQLPFLRGGERVATFELGGVGKRLVFQVPGAPMIWVDGRQGRLNQSEVVVHTLEIDASKDLVTLVWRGEAKALRTYLPEELKDMPFKVVFP